MDMSHRFEEWTPKIFKFKKKIEINMSSFCLNLLNLVHSSKRRLKYSLRANRKKILNSFLT